uniref:Uncharacterized protein n=1 Tax=Arundo donax TaxID=35708 RepID=A0A0A8ZIH6_ARUDO
MQFFPLSFEG